MKKNTFLIRYKKIKTFYKFQKYYLFLFILFFKTYKQSKDIKEIINLTFSLLDRKQNFIPYCKRIKVKNYVEPTNKKIAFIYIWIEKIFKHINAIYCSFRYSIVIPSNDLLAYMNELNKYSDYIDIYYFINPDNYLEYLIKNDNKGIDSELCFLNIFKFFKFLFKFYIYEIKANYITYLDDWNDTLNDINIK